MGGLAGEGAIKEGEAKVSKVTMEDDGGLAITIMVGDAAVVMGDGASVAIMVDVIVVVAFSGVKLGAAVIITLRDAKDLPTQIQLKNLYYFEIFDDVCYNRKYPLYLAVLTFHGLQYICYSAQYLISRD